MKKKFIVFLNAILLLFMCSCGDKTGEVLVVKSSITENDFTIECHHIINYQMPNQYSFFINETPEQYFKKLKNINGYLYEYIDSQTSEKLVLFFENDSYYTLNYSGLVKKKHFYSLSSEEISLNLSDDNNEDLLYYIYMPRHIVKGGFVLDKKMQAYEDWDYIKQYYQRISTVEISEENKTIVFNAVRGYSDNNSLEFVPVILSFDESDNTLLLNKV
ncbi:MAG: hypothetical protein PHE12_00690 [Clostridia bacterium]|nr:hypothetical protein [Clostridia bacterium]